MTAGRDELRHLIDELPEDQVPAAVADIRRRLPHPKDDRPWPPAFFGIGESKDGRTDNARRVEEILAEGFGTRRS
jgi:hypothetical protein